MATGPNNSKENYSLLLSTRAELESAFISDSENEQSPLEKVVKRIEIQPTMMTLRGLVRAHAALLYHELDRHLNPLSFRNEDIGPLVKMDDAQLASFDRDPVYIRTDAESDYDILLLEAGPGAGRFDIEIRQGIQSEENAQALSRELNEGFMAIMDKVDLKQASAELDQIVKPPKTESQTVALPYRRFSAKNRIERPPKLTFKKGEIEQFVEDVEEARALMGIFGVEDAHLQPPENLVELWTQRGRNHLEMVNLFMYIVGRKQEIRETPGAHFRYSVADFENYSPKFTSFELQNTLTQRNHDVLSIKLGLTSNRIDGLYKLADSEVNTARLNYLVWLAGYPRMVKTANEARQKLRQPIQGPYQMIVTMQELFQTASRELREETLLHRVKMSEDYWSDYGAIDYDRAIPDEVDAYNVKLMFLRTAWLLGAYLFTKEKVDTYLQKALQ